MNISPTQGTTATTVDSNRQAKLVDAAQEFEAMMLKEMMKPLSEKNEDDGEEQDSSMSTLSSFGSEAVAKAISKSGGLGIAREVILQLSKPTDGETLKNR